MKVIDTLIKDNIFNILLVIIVLVVVYLHPTNEVMTCDRNFSCSVIHNYFNVPVFSTKFNILPNSSIFGETKKFPLKGGGGDYLGYFYFYDNTMKVISPFISHNRYYSENDFNEQLSEYKKSFASYMESPEKGSIIVVSAGSRFFMIIFIAILLYCIVNMKKFVKNR